MKLPEKSRPRGLHHKRFTAGVDLPSWFSDNLKSIDRNLYLVWHPFRVIYDDIINQYEGALDDPRFCIHLEHGQENWGFVMTDGNGAPIPECKWHVWRHCHDYCGD